MAKVAEKGGDCRRRFVDIAVRRLLQKYLDDCSYRLKKVRQPHLRDTVERIYPLSEHS